MKEYNWRKEREKYRVVPAEQENQQPTNPIPEKKQPTLHRVLSATLTIATLVAIIAWVVVHYGIGKDSSTRLATAAEKNKEAVGLVVLKFDFKDGGKATIPLGTAWAFSKTQFATNAHIIDAIKSVYKNNIRTAGIQLLTQEALQGNHTTLQEYLKKQPKEKAEELINNAEKRIIASIERVKLNIYINDSNRKKYEVTHFQIHRNYGETGINPDIAVLTIDSPHNNYFKIASQTKLLDLKSGTPIAFLGFPMENLSNNNINLNNPVASMQSGIIVAVTDFELKNSGPENNVLIRHNLPATGGASGSPIFNTSGEVVALLFGGNIIISNSQKSFKRAPSAAQINFAVRADLLSGVGVSSPVESLFK